VDWQRQCNALFELDVQLTRTCECQAPRALAAHAAGDEGGIAGVKRLRVLPNGQPNSVKASLRREFGVTENLEYNFHCNACNQDRHHLTETRRIEAAPELLRLQLNPVRVVQREIEGGMENETVPNYNPIQINEHLDLTEYLEPQQVPVAPLKYRLQSVLYHGGGNSRGHYWALVRGPQDAYRVSDRQVDKLDHKSRLWVGGSRGTRAIILMYHRVHQKRP